MTASSSGFPDCCVSWWARFQTGHMTFSTFVHSWPSLLARDWRGRLSETSDFSIETLKWQIRGVSKCVWLTNDVILQNLVIFSPKFLNPCWCSWRWGPGLTDTFPPVKIPQRRTDWCFSQIISVNKPVLKPTGKECHRICRRRYKGGRWM